MGRKRKERKDLPQRVYFKHGAYFFVDRKNKWHRLGTEYKGAMATYADLNHIDVPLITMAAVMDRYQKEILPTKAPRTQQDRLRELRLLRAVFGHMPPDSITPQHVYQYMDRRPPVRANREKSFLSAIFNYAIRLGAATDNPCRLVKRNTETPRNRYVRDWEYEAMYDVCSPVLQCAMDLALLTGLRQGDILKLSRMNCTNEGLEVQTGKTGKVLLIQWTEELRSVVERAKRLPSKIATTWIIHNRHGQKYTSDGFKSLWQRYMKKALEETDLTDRFTFHDLRAKAGSEAEDARLLGHVDKQTLRRHYERAPIKVTPLKRKILDNGG